MLDEAPLLDQAVTEAGVPTQIPLPYHRLMAANRVDVLFRPSGRRLALEPGTNLLEAAREAGLPVAQACGGEALCARCGMQILSGAENLDPETSQEATAKQRNRVAREMRLSCQTRVHGPVEVTASSW